MSLGLKVTIINSRFGSMPQETGGFLDWGKVSILEDTMQVRDGYIGVNAGEMRFDTSNGNAVAKRFQTESEALNIKFPVAVEIYTTHEIKQNAVILKIVDFKFLVDKK